MSDSNSKLTLFEGLSVRKEWDNENEKWWFSVVDVVGILTDQETPRGAGTYWKVLKSRLKQEGNEMVTNCNQLKLEAADGKKYLTDVADLELIINTLAETVAKEIFKSKNPYGYRDNLDVALEGAEIAKNTRKQVEAKTGKPVVSKLNAKDYLNNQLINDNEEDE